MKKQFISLFLILLITLGFAGGCGTPERQPAASFAESLAQAEETGAPAPTAAPRPEPVEISLMMIGDMLMHPGVCSTGEEADGTYNFDHLFAQILPDIREADVRIVNQETILGGTELGISGYPTFNSPQELGDSIAKAGFNVVLHSTNHTLDKGLRAVNNTLNFWRTKHPEIAVLGIHESQDDAAQIYVYEKKGFKVAILNYTYGMNGIPIPDAAPYCVDTLYDEAKVRGDIRRARELADMVIVAPHWGTEYVFEPSSYQNYWSAVFLEEGVDVVLGTHPHVLEPVEMLERNDGHQMLIYYSLGNFVSNQDEIPRLLGGMAKLTLRKEEGRAYIKTYSIDPLVTHKRFGYREITTYKLSDYTQELAAQNKILSDSLYCYTSSFKWCLCGADFIGYPSHGPGNFSLQYCKDFCKAVLGVMYTGK